MGLDITAYRKLTAVRPRPAGDETGYDEGLIWLPPQHAAQFKGREAGIRLDHWYRDAGPDNVFGFRAGSYSGYNRWREWLAALAGHGSPETVWRTPNAPGPFVELINFSDCEGTIGPVVAAKLAKDFAEWGERAKANDAEGYNYIQYCEWRKAFEMAADHGAVAFH